VSDHAARKFSLATRKFSGHAAPDNPQNMRYAALMKLSSITLALALAACGGAPLPSPATASTTTAAATTPEAEPSTPLAPPSPHAATTPEPAAPSPPPEVEAQPEKCDGGWVCVKVSFESRKVEKRETKLIGDPKIESTWSKTSDGRTVSFDAFSKGPVELTLRRKPGNKNEVVVKLKGGEIVIDRRDGTSDDFTHVGVIATEKGGAMLLDLRYMR
jgi:hypothetical protein